MHVVIANPLRAWAAVPTIRTGTGASFTWRRSLRQAGDNAPAGAGTGTPASPTSAIATGASTFGRFETTVVNFGRTASTTRRKRRPVTGANGIATRRVVPARLPSTSAGTVKERAGTPSACNVNWVGTEWRPSATRVRST